MPSLVQLKALDYAAPAAVLSEKETGLPAQLTLAQIIFESGWLKDCPGNNALGIKAHSGVAGRQLLQCFEDFTPHELRYFLSLGDGRVATLYPGHAGNGTERYACLDWFAKYDRLADCFNDHARLITQGHPYAPAWKAYQEDHNYPIFVLSIAKIYAKDASYGGVILAFSTSSTITQALTKARAAMST